MARQDKFPILSLSHEETSASEGNLNAYVSHLFTYIRLTATKSSIHLKNIYIYVYIYIYIYIYSNSVACHGFTLWVYGEPSAL